MIRSGYSGLVSRHKLPPLPPPPPGDFGTLMYSTDYEQQSDIVNDSNQLGLGSISTTTVHTGSGSFKSRVTNSESGSHISSGWRSEVQYDGSLSPDNQPITVEYYLYFETLSSSNVGGLATQWHGNAGGTSGQCSMWISGGDFMVMRSVQAGVNQYQSGSASGGGLMGIETGRWYYFRWEIKYTTGTTGYVRCYIDDVLYYNANNVKTSDGTGQYLKIGQNLFNPPSSESVLYYDGLKIWFS